MIFPYDDRSPRKWRVCVCPSCGKKHKKRVFYTGPASVPPFRCNECDHRVQQSPTDEFIYQHNIPKDMLK